LEVEDMYTMDTDIGEDRVVELELVEREPKGVVLTSHWIGDGATRHRRTHREWKELKKLRWINTRLLLRTPFVLHYNAECRRVKKRVKI
jgi:hypothetical protein